MPIYEKPVHKLLREMVAELGLTKGQVLTRQQVVAWFGERYPKVKQGTVTSHLIRMSTNAPSRVHYGVKPGDDDVFYQTGPSEFTLYDPAVHPPPLRKGGDDGTGGGGGSQGR